MGNSRFKKAQQASDLGRGDSDRLKGYVRLQIAAQATFLLNNPWAESTF